MKLSSPRTRSTALCEGRAAANLDPADEEIPAREHSNAPWLIPGDTISIGYEVTNPFYPLGKMLSLKVQHSLTGTG